MSTEFSTDDGRSLVEPMAMNAFMVSLLGLILPIAPAVVALFMARSATRRIKAADGLMGGMNFVRGAQVLALMNFVILAGIAAAAIYLDS